jgi:adenosine deaminase
MGFWIHFLVMATRHKEKAAMAAHVAAAVTYGNPSGLGHFSRITGFDLAGQEKDNDPMQFQELFMPLHLHFMNITIHAGEMAEDDKIWQALYLLHAKRIGHGLKLVNNEKMMGYIRDYGIAIEMCPSSNIQTNNSGFGELTV